MFSISKTVRLAGAAFLSLAPAAYAQQQSGLPDARMAGMSGMHSNGKPSMDMHTMMKQCGQMHREMAQGKPMAPGASTMMKQCDQMNTSAGPDTQAPAATQDR